MIDEDRFAALLRDIESRRDEFRAQRHVSQDVIEQLKALGLYRGLVPERFGGSGMSPGEFLRRIERISEADGSTGWVASFAFGTKYLASLPVATLEEVYAKGPDVVFAGCVFPPQPAEPVDGGFIVRGRWPFASGCNGASLLGVGIHVPTEEGEGLPMLAVMPAEEVTIDETWDAIGMTGTGSHDLVVEDVLVPANWTFVRGAPPSIDTPTYRYPTLAMAAQVLAVCGLGVARAAINYVVSVADRSASITGAPTLGNRPNVQLHLGECEAALRSARSWFYEVTELAWNILQAGGQPTQQETADLRLAASHAARVGAGVARTCFDMSGTIGIYERNPLSRYLTDAAVVAQHAFIAEGSFISAGKLIAGHPPASGFP